MYSQLLALASVCSLVYIVVGHGPLPPLAFPPRLPMPLHRGIPGPRLIGLRAPVHRPFLFPGHPPPHRKILIIRPPPGAGIRFPTSPLRRVFRPLPTGFLRRRPRTRQFRRPPIRVSKYGYHRPDFFRSGPIRRRTYPPFAGNHPRPFSRDWRHWYPRSGGLSRGDLRDRISDFRSERGRFNNDYNNVFDRDNRWSFSGDFLGVSRRFDTTGNVRSAIPRRGDHVNDLNRNGDNFGIGRGAGPIRNSVHPPIRMNSRFDLRRVGQRRPRIRINTPALKETIQNVADSAGDLINSVPMKAATIAHIGQGPAPFKAGNLIDLTDVDLPGNDGFGGNLASAGFPDSLIDLRHMDNKYIGPEIAGVKQNVIDKVETDIAQVDANLNNAVEIPVKTSAPQSPPIVVPSNANPGDVGPDTPPIEIDKKGTLNTEPVPDVVVTNAGNSNNIEVPVPALDTIVSNEMTVPKPDAVLGGTHENKLPGQVSADVSAALTAPIVESPAPVLPPVEVVPSVTNDNSPVQISTNVDLPSIEAAAPLEPVIDTNANSNNNNNNNNADSFVTANVVGTDQTLNVDPLSPEVSIVELGPENAGAIASGADLAGLGNVDVLTLSSDGFAALEKAIQSGLAISADVLDSIISGGGATGAITPGGSAAAGPNLVVLDHPSAGHGSPEHPDHGVEPVGHDAGPVIHSVGTAGHGQGDHGGHGVEHVGHEVVPAINSVEHVGHEVVPAINSVEHVGHEVVPSINSVDHVGHEAAHAIHSVGLDEHAAVHSTGPAIPPPPPPQIPHATKVLGAGHGGASLHELQHGPSAHGAESVGVVGDPVGGIEANGSTDILGLFALPTGSKFPQVPKSVSSIPSSIGKILTGAPSKHAAHGTPSKHGAHGAH